MVKTTYKILSELSPIRLQYNQTDQEKLNISTTRYKSGYKFYELQGFKSYQDIAINKETCLVLTSSVSLHTIFNTSETINIGKIPASIVLQPRNSTIYYLKEQTNRNTISLSLTSSSIFYIQPIFNTNEVEIFINGKYLQVKEEYPYETFLNTTTLDDNEIHRQRFQITQKNDIISFKTKTSSGYRYLSLNNDNILRATGLVLDDTVFNDYIFTCIPITTIKQKTGFIPDNNWVTYFFNVQDKTKNKTVDINKNYQDTNIHYLVNFSFEEATETGIANINIASLKTNITPTGGPAPLTLTRVPITTTTTTTTPAPTTTTTTTTPGPTSPEVESLWIGLNS
jgi:hypothetical protein